MNLTCCRDHLTFIWTGKKIHMIKVDNLIPSKHVGRCIKYDASCFSKHTFESLKNIGYMTCSGPTELGNKTWAPPCDRNNHCTQTLHCFNCPRCCLLNLFVVHKNETKISHLDISIILDLLISEDLPWVFQIERFKCLLSVSLYIFIWRSYLGLWQNLSTIKFKQAMFQQYFDFIDTSKIP